MGAQPGNINSLKHGRQAKRARERYGLTIANMAKRFPGIHASMCRFRNWLEDTLEMKVGHPLTIVEIAAVNLIVTFEMTARIAEFCVKDGKSQNTVTDMRTACWARTNRDSRLHKLGLVPEAVAEFLEDKPADMYEDDAEISPGL